MIISSAKVVEKKMAHISSTSLPENGSRNGWLVPVPFITCNILFEKLAATLLHLPSNYVAQKMRLL